MWCSTDTYRSNNYFNEQRIAHFQDTYMYHLCWKEIWETLLQNNMHKQAIQMESFLTCVLWFHHKSLNTNLCEFHCWVNAYQNESIHLDNKWYCFTQVSDSSSLWNIEILLNPQKLMSTILDETTLLFMYLYLFVDFKRLIIDTIHS